MSTQRKEKGILELVTSMKRNSQPIKLPLETCFYKKGERRDSN